MNKRMKTMLLIVGILFGVIFLYKFILYLMFQHYIATHQRIVTVSTMKVSYSLWQPRLAASGSLRAIRGVNVTTELAGMVKYIYFTPGRFAKKNQILVQLNADSDIAQLHALQANAELARITYERDKAQFAIHGVSKQTVDSDLQNLKSLRAQVAEQAAIVEKKTIRAPFDGRLGISLVNPGQFVNPGDKVVTLQTLDPIYADFFLPQQVISQLVYGQKVVVTSDSYKDEKFEGKITTIEPAVDVSTRNIAIEATVDNPNYKIIPGMFVSVEVVTAQPKSFLTLPQAAVSFNPYGSIVYLVKQDKDKKGNKILVANQIFVSTGETRGDQVKILSGLKEGDVVVTSGQLKLNNGSRIAINNTVQPANSPMPYTPNEY